MKKTILAALSLTLILTSCTNIVIPEGLDADGGTDISENVKESTSVKTAAFSGSFTATVEKLIPDYCVLPGNTVAVVHYFQSMPFLLRFDEDMTGKLSEGAAYVFDFEPFEVLIPETEQQPDIADYMYGVKVTGYREAKEEETGMGSLVADVKIK